MSDISEQLASAPQHVQLAIDLIMLLEQHDLDPADVLAALDIVKDDFTRKLQTQDKNN